MPTPFVETFAADADLNLENQDHLKYVSLKIKIRSLMQRDLEDQDQITILILRTRLGISPFCDA